MIRWGAAVPPTTRTRSSTTSPRATRRASIDACARWLLPLLSLLFFFSGPCALVYQVMWLRLLALVFGVTVYAASTVLASFMGGLALGSFAAGRVAGRLRSPLARSASLEIGVGVSALRHPAAPRAVKSVWVALQPSLPASLPFLTVARFVGAFARAYRADDVDGRDAADRDAIGARQGDRRSAAASGCSTRSTRPARSSARSPRAFISWPTSASRVRFRSPRRSTSRSAATRDRSVAGCARAWRLIGSASSADGCDCGRPRRPDRCPALDAPCSGRSCCPALMSLALEIVWFRMLVTLLRPTAYAFTIMLAAVLAGIAFGSAIAAPLLRAAARWLADTDGRSSCSSASPRCCRSTRWRASNTAAAPGSARC